jgi:hypothetical protein
MAGGQSETVLLYLSFAVRSLALDWNSKLSIRMVAGFAELADRKGHAPISDYKTRSKSRGTARRKMAERVGLKPNEEA